MSHSEQFEWVAFYREFAETLLQYKKNRHELVEKIKGIYSTTGLHMPMLEKDNQLVDIDPFTVFGLFNKSSMKESNRITIVSAVAKLFDISAQIPTSFESIPVVNNQNATFYHFVPGRQEGDMDALWDLFESALAYASTPTQAVKDRLFKSFHYAIGKKGNGNSKITMGLYWIAPHSFLNLDRRNMWYIYESGKIPADVVSTLPTVQAKIEPADYFQIVETLKSYLDSGKSTIKSFIELSYEAWRLTSENDDGAQETVPMHDGMDTSSISDEDVASVHYWIYSPGSGAADWEDFYKEGIMGIGWEKIGNLKAYPTKKDMKQAMKQRIDPTKTYANSAYATWQFANEMKVGDVVFAKKGMRIIVGRGIVESDYIYDPKRDKYNSIRKVRWTHKGEWPHPSGKAVMKTLTDITPYTDYVNQLNTLFVTDETDEVEETQITYPKYSRENFLSDVYMDSDEFDVLVELVKNKKNVILQGAPGVGKTYAAKRLAYAMMGVKDPSRVMMVQFHQSYSYEDFIMGFRPSEAGFELKKGVFYNFCKKAEIDSDNAYFFIIDEINRGNLSKIFGELFMLIENDKRGAELQLLYSDELFSVPANIYIIGMMNTADRSLAILDYALRRRFAFYDMKPGFENEGFKAYRASVGSSQFDKLIHCMENLNQAIASDESLGEGFCIGHSYFCNLKEATNGTLSRIIEYEVIPLLKEYWFDEPSKVKDWTDNLRSAIR